MPVSDRAAMRAEGGWEPDPVSVLDAARVAPLLDRLAQRTPCAGSRLLLQELALGLGCAQRPNAGRANLTPRPGDHL